MPYTPSYQVTSHLLQLLERITQLRTKIETSPISVKWAPKLAVDARNRLTHSSTAIEGNPLTLREVQILAEGGEVKEAAEKSKREVLNYLAALRYISSHAGKKTITNEDILKLHTLVGKNALEREPIGSYRTYQVYVGSHVPPEPGEIKRLMSELLAWFNGKGQTLPAVFSSAIFHYQFEYIHPFGDGNGRVGRLVATWELYRRQFDTYHIFSVDEVFLEHRQRYYAALDNVRQQHGNLTGWLEFVSEAVEMALERVWERIAMVKVPAEPFRLNIKQERLLKLLRESPLGIIEIQRKLEVSKAGAHFLLKPLIENKIVTRRGGHKTGKYVLA